MRALGPPLSPIVIQHLADCALRVFTRCIALIEQRKPDAFRSAPSIRRTAFPPPLEMVLVVDPDFLGDPDLLGGLRLESRL